MRTVTAFSPFETLVHELHEKGFHEFKMTKAGFTADRSKFYDPRELEILNVYHFEDVINPSESFYIYVMKDNTGLQGYCVDATADFEKNEENLFHWFLTKVPGDKTIN